MNKHTDKSSFREKLIEHVLIGDLLKYSWLHANAELEISKPEVDDSGYDLIAEACGTIRHIQLKASFSGSTTAKQKVHIRLGEKPSGCLVWVFFCPKTLDLGPFYFYGGSPGEKLPNLDEKRIARHSRGNKDGYKAERPNIRELNRGDFERLDSVTSLYGRLFRS